MTSIVGVLTGPVAQEVEKAVLDAALPVVLKGLGSAADAGTISNDVSKVMSDVLKVVADAQKGAFSWTDDLTTIEDILQGLVDLENKPVPTPPTQ